MKLLWVILSASPSGINYVLNKHEYLDQYGQYAVQFEKMSLSGTNYVLNEHEGCEIPIELLF